MQVVGTVVASAANPADQDIDLQVEVTLNGVILTSTVNGATVPYFDAGPPPGNPITFDCNSGDTGSVTQMDVNSVGNSILSAPVPFTVPTFVTPPTTVPGQPGVPTVSFAPATLQAAKKP